MAFDFEGNNNSPKSGPSRPGSSPVADSPGGQPGTGFRGGPAGGNNGFQSSFGGYSNNDSTGNGFSDGPSVSNGQDRPGNYGEPGKTNVTGSDPWPNDGRRDGITPPQPPKPPRPPIDVPWRFIIYVTVVAFVIGILYFFHDTIAATVSNLVAGIIYIVAFTVTLLVTLKFLIFPPGKKK